MRILFLSHRYTDTTIGGLAEFLNFLPRYLIKLGHSCFIYTQSKDKNFTNQARPTLLASGAIHYCGPFLKPRFFLNKKELMPILHFCQQEKIDLIHAQGTYRAGFMAMHIKKQIGIPYVVTSHSDILGLNSKRIQRSTIRKRCKKVLENAAFVTHLTPDMQAQSHQIHPTFGKEAIISNGIDLKIWREHGEIAERDYCLSIGRLEPEKGVLVLIDAYAELVKQGMQTALVIAGTGSMEATLKQKVNNLNLPLYVGLDYLTSLPKASVIFTGYVREQEKLNLIKQAKLILFAPQLDEAFGIVQLEALAAGKVLIASEIAATRYLQSLGIHTELIAHPENSKHWLGPIQSLLSNESLRRSIIDQNSRYIDQFDWEIVAKSYLKVYKLNIK